MKRYDRLSSSKSDLHLNSSSGGGHQPLTSTTSSGGVLLKSGEVEVLEGNGKSHLGHSRLASSSEIILVEAVTSSSSSRKSATSVHLESTYSSTENIIPPSCGGDLGAEEDHIPEEEVLGGEGGISPWETPISVGAISSSSSTTGSTQPLVQLPSTNTFRSFIKTKTSSGIGIMRGKDHHHHHHHHHSGKALEEDEEALQLCDSESTVSSVIGAGDLISSSSPVTALPLPSSTSSVTPILLPPPPPPQPQPSYSSSSASLASSALVSSSIKGHHPHHPNHHLLQHYHNQTPLSSSSSVPAVPSSYQHPHHHQAIFLANPCHSTTSTTSCGGCSISSSTSQVTLPSSAQTTLTSIDSVTSSSTNQLLYSSNSNSQKRESNGGNGKHYHLNSTASSPLPTSNTSQSSASPGNAVPPVTKSRHRTFIPPILKPARFVKNVTSSHNHHNSHHGSKGNLLFNVKSSHSSSGHKSSKSKQRLAEGGKDHHLQRMNSELAVESLKSDRLVVTQPEEDRRRRTIIIEKANNSFGFTLQTYGIKHCREGEVELITYVDEVAYGGPAFRGGMRPGDVILSINGRDVEKADHRTLVSYIGTCEKTMRLVVLFEDCVRKIELNIKYLKLKKALQTKLAQIEILNQRENQLLLNAALRTRSAAEDAENWENINNNNNNININNLCISSNTSSSSAKLKKYKCKSLDVSLDDLNANLVVESNSSPVPTIEPWPGTIAAEMSATVVTSTTLPQTQIKGEVQSPETPLYSEEEEDEDEDEDDDEDENFAAGKDVEKRTLHSRGGGGKRKTNGNGSSGVPNSGAPRIGSAGTMVLSVVNSAEQQLGLSSSSSKSKSLPQSVTNSMDCLTNEAYEDDEDLIGGEGGNQRKITDRGRGGGLRMSSTATHDKDFITKL